MSQWISNPLAAQFPKSYAACDLQKDSKSIIPPIDAKPKDVRSKSKNLAVFVSTKRNQFLTQDSVEGQLQINCNSAKSLKIGKITVSLIGIEENLTSKLARPRKFLSKSLLVQDPEIATTDAVEMGLPDAHSMWVAKVGVTAIDFKIPFAETAATNIVTDIYDSRGNYPSSYWNPKMGGVRYIIALVVEFKTGREPMVPLAAYQEIYCIESVPFHLKSNFQELSPLTSSLYGEQKLELKSGLGFDRKSCSVLKLSCSLQTLEIEGGIDNGVWASGGYGYVTVAIENGSSRPVTGLKVQLHQIEKTYRFMEVSQEFSPTAYKKKIISTLIFKSTNGARKSGLEISGIGGKLVSWAKKETARNESKEVVQWMDIVPGENRRHVVALRLPLNDYSVRYSSLIDVAYYVSIEAKLKGGKAISLDLPITILHPSSFLERSPDFEAVVLPKAKEPIRYNFEEYSGPAAVSPPTELLKSEGAFTSFATLAIGNEAKVEVKKSLPSRLIKRISSSSAKPRIDSPSPAALDEFSKLTFSEIH